MTKGAIAMRQLKEDELKRKSQEKIEANKLADKEKQRKWEAGENRKSRIKDYITGGLRAFKFPTNLNDPTFYKQYIKELDRYCNIPTYQRLGNEKFAQEKLLCKYSDLNKFHVPGVMVIPHYPVIGPQPNGVNASGFPINQALNRTKEQILKSNSRSNVNYEGADIGLNLFCTADIVTMICEIRRALLIYQTYQGDNAYLARYYLEALHFSWTDIDTNIATYRKQFAKVVTKFNSSIVAPADVTLYARKIFLASNVFKDRAGTVKQVYMYRQAAYLQLSATGDYAAASDWDFISNITLQAMFAKLDLMIEAITSNPDYVEMYADMRSAISNTLQLDSSINPEDTIAFNDDPINRFQLHNTKTLPSIIGMGSNSFKIPTNSLRLSIDASGYLEQGDPNANGRTAMITTTGQDAVARATAKAAISYYYGNKDGVDGCDIMLFDMDKDDVSGDDILEITRNCFDFDYVSVAGDDITARIGNVGTEIFLRMEMYALTTNNTLVSRSAYSYSMRFADGSLDITNSVYLYSKFDWAPMYTFVGVDKTSTDITPVSNAIYDWCNVNDLDHTFAVSFKDLAHLHEACVLSEVYLVTSQFKH